MSEMVCEHWNAAVIAYVPLWLLPPKVEVRPWENREAAFCLLDDLFICEWHRMGMDDPAAALRRFQRRLEDTR